MFIGCLGMEKLDEFHVEGHVEVDTCMLSNRSDMSFAYIPISQDTTTRLKFHTTTHKERALHFEASDVHVKVHAVEHIGVVINGNKRLQKDEYGGDTCARDAQE